MVLVLIIRRLPNCLSTRIEGRIARNFGCIVTRAEGVACNFKIHQNAYPHIDRGRRSEGGPTQTKSKYMSAGNEEAIGRLSEESEVGPDTNKGRGVNSNLVFGMFAYLGRQMDGESAHI